MRATIGFVQKSVKEIISDIARKYNMSMVDTYEIISSQFEYVAKEMASGDMNNPDSFNSILLRYLGTFTFQRGKHTAIGYNIKRAHDKRIRELQSKE